MKSIVTCAIAFVLGTGILTTDFLPSSQNFGQEDTTVVDVWPDFRGPMANGHANARNLPTQFGEGQNVAWKAAIPGRGWSSPVVVDNQIWMTTAIEVLATGEERQRKMAAATTTGLSAFSRVKLQAICVNRQSGELVRAVDLFDIEDPPLIHSLNSFASPSPVCDDRRVYCHFGTFGTAAIDRDSGEVAWRSQHFQIDHETGPGSSPILWQGQLIAHFDGCDDQYVVSLDAETGLESWRVQRSGEMPESPSLKKAFSTPIVVLRGGKPQLVSTAANWIYGYDPTSGRELWKVSYGQLGFSNVARPIVHDSTLYVCSCFMRSKLIAFDISGDKALHADSVKWTFNREVSTMPSPIFVENQIYFVSDERGIATCLRADNGEQVWQERLGGSFSASPVYADGKLYFASRQGIVFVVLPGKEPKVLSSNQLDARIMASPAAVGNSLFLRTEESLYCIKND